MVEKRPRATLVYKLKIFYFSLRAGGTEEQLLHGREILEGRIRLASQSPDDDKVRDDLQWVDLLYDDVAGYVFKLDVVHECFDFPPENDGVSLAISFAPH